MPAQGTASKEETRLGPLSIRLPPRWKNPRAEDRDEYFGQAPKPLSAKRDERAVAGLEKDLSSSARLRRHGGSVSGDHARSFGERAAGQGLRPIRTLHAGCGFDRSLQRASPDSRVLACRPARARPLRRARGAP